MTYLLDVNVLIALIDAEHVVHEQAHAWFAGIQSWATCPITENGVARIVGGHTYPLGPGSPAPVLAILNRMTKRPGHIFWADDLSLTDTAHVDPAQLLTSAQVTDSYLLALAVAKDGKLATFDRRLSTKAVKGGREALHLIPA